MSRPRRSSEEDQAARPVLSADYPENYREDSPSYAITDRSRGGVLVFVDGLPSMGKTVLLQHFAQQQLGSHRVFWWGELRPQWGTFYPNQYQLLVADGIEAHLYSQTPNSDVEENLKVRAVTGLATCEQFYAAARKDLLNVLVFPERTRAYDVLDFLEWITLRRKGLFETSVFIDETAKISPGSVTRYDGSFDRGLKLARILEDTRKAHVSVFMSSHAPSDLWYVCLGKVQFHVAAAGRHNPRDRHSRKAHDALAVGDFYVNGPTLAGKRYDRLHVEAPPPTATQPMILRTTPEFHDMRWGDWPWKGKTAGASALSPTIRRLASLVGVTPQRLTQWSSGGRIPAARREKLARSIQDLVAGGAEAQGSSGFSDATSSSSPGVATP